MLGGLSLGEFWGGYGTVSNPYGCLTLSKQLQLTGTEYCLSFKKDLAKTVQMVHMTYSHILQDIR